MKRRLTLTLGLIVLLPLAVLFAFGVALARQDKERIQSRYEHVLTGRLTDINSGVAKLVAARERELLQALEIPSFDPDRIRTRVRGSRLLRQLFVVGPDNTLIHPRSDGVLTEEERNFLERTKSLWESGESFWSPEEVATTSPYRSRSMNAPLVSQHGWHTWFWGEGLRLIFWMRQPSGTIVGAEVERAALMADIIGQLPAAGYSSTPLPEGRITLVDAQAHPLYQWGAFSPAKDTPPTVAQNLPAPFTAWALHYFVPANGIGSALRRSTLFNMTLGLAALTLSLIALAIYFYRESSRDMHEASRRVTFVNQVSHELKTPLTNIRMYAELLEKRIPEDDTRTRNYSGILVSETQRLSRLITNVLTFASHRRGKLKLHTHPAAISTVVDSVVASFAPALDALGITVVTEGKADRCIALDVDVLEQILGNLITNVEKYATNAKELRITQQQDQGIRTKSQRSSGNGQ